MSAERARLRSALAPRLGVATGCGERRVHSVEASRMPSCWLADPLPTLPPGGPELAAGIRPPGPADDALAELWISAMDAAIFESRYDSGADRSQLRMARTLPSERVHAAGRRLPGSIVYSEYSEGSAESKGPENSNEEGSADGMRTDSRLTYREIREPLEPGLVAPARFPLAALDLGRLAGALSVQRAFAGGAGH